MMTKLIMSVTRFYLPKAGNIPAPPGPPAAPTKDQAAQNLLQQGKKPAPVGFDSTILGDTRSQSGMKTILGG